MPATSKAKRPPVAIIMGSVSDWSVMSHTARILDELGIGYQAEVVSAHRTPSRMYEFASSAQRRGLRVIVAGAGGAAHLPGMVASITPLPVVGVPIPSTALDGLDSLLSMAQMPAHSPVATMAIGVPGARNAALMVGSMLAMAGDRNAASRLRRWRRRSSEAARSSSSKLGQTTS